MSSVTVTRSNTAKERLRALDSIAKDGLLRGGVYLVNRTKNTINAFAPKGRATGNMIRSLGVSPVKLVNGYLTVRVGPSPRYSWWVHQGTGPKAGHGKRKPPPTDAILSWVKEKGLVPTFTMVKARSKKTGRFTGGLVKKRIKKVDVERQQRSLAFLIARKIGREGTAPFPFLTTTFKMERNNVHKIIISSILRGLRGAT